jgi:hypothetical protein
VGDGRDFAALGVWSPVDTGLPKVAGQGGNILFQPIEIDPEDGRI